MDWLWPGSLALLVLIPLIVALYIWILKRRKRAAVRFSSLSLVRAAQPHHSRWQRHLPFVIFLTAISSLIVAMGRPVAIVSVPTSQTTIVLSMDVSRSMCATDIEPSRLIAAEQAALSFIENQKPDTQIGVVAFADFAEQIQRPTTDREALQSAIESLMTGRRTAIGSGILEAIDVISEIDPNVAPSVRDGSSELALLPVPQGAYTPSIIVLLTDGVNNAGPFPTDAAQQAADRGIKVYTIGFGTENGGNPICPAQLLGGGPLGSSPGISGGGGTGRFRRGIDEETLMEVAKITGGEYYAASSAAELNEVYQSLPTYQITKHEITEISVAFTAAGAFLAIIAIVLAMHWQALP